MNIELWVKQFDDEKNHFDYKVDALESNKIVLLPGRFYILQYKPKTTKKDIVLNTRPIILSLGMSKADPESFLCIDLCMMPMQIRLKFVQMFYDMFDEEITKNMKSFPFTEMADMQAQIKDFNYKALSKIDKLYPVMNAIKRYKIKNTKKIYSLSYTDVYKVLGKFADENWFINGNIGEVQKEFLKKSMYKK